MAARKLNAQNEKLKCSLRHLSPVDLQLHSINSQLSTINAQLSSITSEIIAIDALLSAAASNQTLPKPRICDPM